MNFCRSENKNPEQAKPHAHNHISQTMSLLWNYMNGATEVCTSAYHLL